MAAPAFGKFMNHKDFHPASKSNQKKLWIAEETEKYRKVREKERAEELRKERIVLLSEQRRKKTPEEEMSFMYRPPPGYVDANKDEDEFGDNGDADNEDKTVKSEEPSPVPTAAPGAALPTVHPKDKLHPALEKAPVEGEYVEKGSLKSLNPLGVNVRNVRCVRCGMKGHSSGDRECPMANNNPLDKARKDSEDPMNSSSKPTRPSKPVTPNPYQSAFILKHHIVKEKLGETSTGSVDDTNATLPTEEEDPETAFLNSLTRKQRRQLLKALEKEQKKKTGKKRPRSSSTSDSGSDTSSADSDSDNSSESDRKRGKRRKPNNQEPPRDRHRDQDRDRYKDKDRNRERDEQAKEKTRRDREQEDRKDGHHIDKHRDEERDRMGERDRDRNRGR